jgi:Ca-activated chloride channel homolog
MSKGFSLILALTVTHFAQPGFRSTTELVALNVTVTDERGNVVRGLTREAFSVSEDEKAQSIVQFAAESVPLSLVVALDASRSMGGHRIEFAREAVLRLLDRLSPDDELFVFGFNDRVFNITRGNKNRDEVARALATVHPNGGTALYDAVSAGVQVLHKARHDRRALVVISDGNDAIPTSRLADPRSIVDAREASAISTVSRSEALVYAIGIDSRNAGAVDRLNVAALDRLTKPTGGVTIVASSDDAVAGAAEQLGDELRLQYVLGFLPAHPGDGKLHHVRVSVAGCDKCHVRSRAVFIG